ncbi:hypothetical protein RFI_05460 [Reticulomyxa filosa]|uniref:Uncharacterized protein n=1 Tax=Reticulomyxa filosa TaxID=46433 RepID=X6P088_RETFI|nr:hypothetical protein RFI_05460 [Reticulomyxa filosa]|eukprot:ETO31656.1 hypothetical protein RFI_05460 [Reticulomyxa filosa]
MGNVNDLSPSDMIEFMQEKCPNIAQTSHLHQTTFYKYLSDQFIPLAHSVFLRNEDIESQEWPFLFKYEVTKSVIAMGTDLSCRLYQGRRRTHSQASLKENKEEDEFYLCKKWKQSKEFLYLVNRDDCGLLNVLTCFR